MVVAHERSPDPNRGSSLRHQSESRGAVEHRVAPPIRLHHGVHIPYNVESELFGSAPAFGEVGERQVLVLVGAESKGRHRPLLISCATNVARIGEASEEV
jgi:hypothetical protein